MTVHAAAATSEGLPAAAPSEGLQAAAPSHGGGDEHRRTVTAPELRVTQDESEFTVIELVKGRLSAILLTLLSANSAVELGVRSLLTWQGGTFTRPYHWRPPYEPLLAGCAVNELYLRPLQGGPGRPVGTPGRLLRTDTLVSPQSLVLVHSQWNAGRLTRVS